MMRPASDTGISGHRKEPLVAIYTRRRDGLGSLPRLIKPIYALPTVTLQWSREGANGTFNAAA